MNLLALGLLLAYLLVLLVFAYYGFRRREDTLEDFFVGRREIGKFVAFMTFSATLFSSFTLVGMPGFFYTHGIGSWVFIAFADVFMAVMIWFFGYRIWALGKKFRYITPTEFLRDRFDSNSVMIIAGLIGILFLLPYISIQLVGASILLSTAGLPSLIGSLGFVLVILVYSEFGGMRTVAWTDAFQGSLFLLIGLLIGGLFLAWHPGNLFLDVLRVDPALLSVPGPAGLFTYPMMISFFIMIIFMPATQPQLTVRFFLPKSKKVLKTMMIASPIFAFLAMLPTLVIGLGARLIDPALASGDLALPTVLTVLPGFVVALALISVIASSMSTVDSQILVLSSIITKDLFVNLRKKKISRKARMWIARLSMFLLLGAAFLISVKPPKLIVTLSILSFAGTLQLLPAMMGALFWRRTTKWGALASMVVGVAVLSLAQWGGWRPWFGFHGAIWGLAFGMLALVLVSLVTRPPTRNGRKVVAFLEKEFGML
ncbi:MAG: sodium:solute symporter family protein [DPANN group archaeon]|nr:sodium:solute symporter family protein [DPANN group archaeon]